MPDSPKKPDWILHRIRHRKTDWRKKGRLKGEGRTVRACLPITWNLNFKWFPINNVSGAVQKTSIVNIVHMRKGGNLSNGANNCTRRFISTQAYREELQGSLVPQLAARCHDFHKGKSWIAMTTDKDQANTSARLTVLSNGEVSDKRSFTSLKEEKMNVQNFSKEFSPFLFDPGTLFTWLPQILLLSDSHLLDDGDLSTFCMNPLCTWIWAGLKNEEHSSAFLFLLLCVLLGRLHATV